MDILAKMLSLATFIYGIVALATGNPNTPELIIMITYLILEALNIITVIVLSVFVLFLPLICCLGCVYFMFFGVNLVTNRDDLRIPDSVDATARII